MKPIISVVIPNYNRSNIILPSVESVLAQTVEDIEVIVVDDCSTDESVQQLKQIKDSRFSVIRLKNHGGANVCRNFGVKKSKGTYLAFQDSGTLWKADKLEKQLQKIQNADAGLVYCREESDRIRSIPEESLDLVYKEERCLEILVKRNIIDTPTIFMKRECFERVGGFDESLKRWQDYDFVLRVAQKYPIGIVDEVLVTTKTYQNSISNNSEYLVNTIPKFLLKHKKFFREYGGPQELIDNTLLLMISQEGVSYPQFLEQCKYMDRLLEQDFPGLIFCSAGKALEKKRKWCEAEEELAEHLFQNFMKHVHKGNPFYIYGAGNYAVSLLNRLKEIGCCNGIKAFVVSQKEKDSQIAGIPVMGIEELKEEQEIPILVGVAEKTQLEILRMLCERKYANIVVFKNRFWKYMV